MLERRTDTLKPHPKNAEIYGNEQIPQDFIDSIRTKGILVPLVIKEDGTIISGHRRWRVAQLLGMQSVPVEVVHYDDELDEREAIIAYNRQREKTFEQRMAEGDELRAIEAERARRRIQEHGGTAPGRPANTCGNISTGDTGKTRDKVAAAIGLGSGRTYDKALKVWEAAKRGDETAQKAVAALNANKITINAAYKLVKRTLAEEEPRPKPVSNGPVPRLYVGRAENLDFLPDEFVDVIITSPPYNLGSEYWPMGGDGRIPRTSGVGYEDAMPEAEYQAWQLQVLKELYRVAKPGASLFYNHKVRQRGGTIIHPLDWLRSPENPWTLRQEIIWDRGSTHNHSPKLFWPHDERIYWLTKGQPVLPDRPIGMPTVWSFPGPIPGTWHPAPFPEELPRRCLEAVGRPGIVVLDPFGGSMTTCAVAQKMGYESIGVDINPEYVERARRERGWVTTSAA
ncbi:MAG: ParB N-terminal domain-containing protein [Limnochordales bacterium]|nr:ParB N-terminal domain-containing protein [Limnochordales bacterium]